MESLLNGPAHNNNNNSGNKFYIIRKFAYDSFHFIIHYSITVMLSIVIHVVVAFPFYITHLAIILFHRVYDCKCADSRCFNMSFSYLLLVRSLTTNAHTPNGGKYLWYLMIVFPSILFCRSNFLGENSTIKDRQGF